MHEAARTLTAPDGTALHVYVWSPDEGVPARGGVQIVHGLSEHAGRYRETARGLTDAGYRVWAADLRGHGRSAASAADLGFFAEREGWWRLVEDLEQVRAAFAAEAPEQPLALLGHSLGGLLVQAWLARHPTGADAILLGSTTVGGGILARLGQVVGRVERLRQGARGRSKLLSGMVFDDYNRPFQPARTRFDWLSRDEAVVDAYIADPLSSFDPTNQAWLDIAEGVVDLGRHPAFAEAPRDLPILLMAGARDPESKNGRTLARLAADLRHRGFTRVGEKFWPEARHEPLNEINREEIVADIVAWLDQAIGGAAGAKQAS